MGMTCGNWRYFKDRLFFRKCGLSMPCDTMQDTACYKFASNEWSCRDCASYNAAVKECLLNRGERTNPIQYACRKFKPKQ